MLDTVWYLLCAQAKMSAVPAASWPPRVGPPPTLCALPVDIQIRANTYKITNCPAHGNKSTVTIGGELFKIEEEEKTEKRGKKLQTSREWVRFYEWPIRASLGEK